MEPVLTRASGVRNIFRRQDWPSEITMDLRHARYFLAILDCGTFTGAAKVCNVSQPSVTAAIQRFEATIGGRLFERSRTSTSRAAPTPLARAIRPHIEQMLEYAERAFVEASRQKDRNDATN
jgi:DNA-binding transcriptional LysR family regulator